VKISPLLGQNSSQELIDILHDCILTQPTSYLLLAGRYARTTVLRLSKMFVCNTPHQVQGNQYIFWIASLCSQ
jgi:hypothetical protein